MVEELIESLLHTRALSYLICFFQPTTATILCDVQSHNYHQHDGVSVPASLVDCVFLFLGSPLSWVAVSVFCRSRQIEIVCFDTTLRRVEMAFPKEVSRL